MRAHLHAVAKILLVLAAMACSCSICSASATALYIAQNSTGAANGADCADALPVSTFNSSANWGIAGNQIGPGTTVHLCGIFTAATAGTTMLTARGSGASGAPITILFEPGAVLTSPAWGRAINLNSQSYIIVDGGANGLIQNTANGTGLTYQLSSVGVLAANTTNCEVKNLTIANLYVHTGGSVDITVDQTHVNAVQSYPPALNMTVDFNTFYDCGWCISGYGFGYVVHDNNVYNMCHGIALGVNSGNYFGMKIYNNHFHDMTAWDTIQGLYHLDGIHVWGQTGGVASGIDIYDNEFDGDSGQKVTAWLFLEDNVSTTRVFNNVFITPAGRTMGNGALSFYGRLGDTSADSNAAYNNTFIDNNATDGGATGIKVLYQTNFTAQNNLLVGSNTNIDFENSTITTVDYNVYQDLFADNKTTNTFSMNGKNYNTLAAWQIACSCDTDSLLLTQSQINLSATAHLQSGSMAIGTVANLSLLNITPLDSDKWGLARPPSGPWDPGAQIYVLTSSQPAPPTGTTAMAH